MRKGLGDFVEHGLNSSDPIFRNSMQALLYSIAGLSHPLAYKEEYENYETGYFTDVGKCPVTWQDNGAFGISSWHRLNNVKYSFPNFDMAELEVAFKREWTSDNHGIGFFAEVDPWGEILIHFHYNDPILVKKSGVKIYAEIYDERCREDFDQVEKFFTFESLRSNQPAKRTRSLYE
jgi:hypothetical protein